MINCKKLSGVCGEVIFSQLNQIKCTCFSSFDNRTKIPLLKLLQKVAVHEWRQSVKLFYFHCSGINFYNTGSLRSWASTYSWQWQFLGAENADKEPIPSFETFSPLPQMKALVLKSILGQCVRQSHSREEILDAFLLSFSQCWVWSGLRSFTELGCYPCSLTLAWLSKLAWLWFTHGLHKELDTSRHLKL